MNAVQTYTVERVAIPTIADSIDQLLDIYDDYKGWTDPTSRKVINWIEESFAAINGLESEEVVVGIAVARIEILFRQILVNPFNDRPLATSVLENGRIWEREVYHQVRELFQGRSPIDGAEMAGLPIVHMFAQSIRAWADQCIALAVINGIGAVGPVERDPLERLKNEPRLAYAFYKKMGQNILLEEQNQKIQEEQRAIQENMQLALIRVDQEMKQLQEVGRVADERALTLAQEQQQEIEGRIASIERTHEETSNHLRAEIDTHREKISSLEREIEIVSQTNGAFASELKIQKEEEIRAHKRVIATLGGDLRSLEERHREEKVRWAAQLAEAHEARLIDLRLNGERISRLQEAAAQDATDLRDAKAKIEEATQKEELHQVEIRRLMGALAHRQREIDDIRNNSGGGKNHCIIC